LSLSQEIKEKIALFCSVAKEAVIEEKDVTSTIYEVPIELHNQGLDAIICQRLSLTSQSPDLTRWKAMLHAAANRAETLTIGMVGKYMDHQDAYKSVFESLEHSAIATGVKLEIRKFEADKIVHQGILDPSVEGCDGYLIPGGFGARGWEGKILTAQHCRINQIPYFGLCLGMQVMIVEFARHVLGLKEAHSTEVDLNTPDPVIALMLEQKQLENLGGTMRLGSYPCTLLPGSLAYKAYGQKEIFERHRHRYEFNNQYKQAFLDHGMIFSGTLTHGTLCEISENKNHPWMLGVQFHPEFKSRPTAPHPLFLDFIKTVALMKKGGVPNAAHSSH
jgi:CTP synthase